MKKASSSAASVTACPAFHTDQKGQYRGIDVDVCRAPFAAAVFGDAKKVKFTPLTAKERFTALQSGEVDAVAQHHRGPAHAIRRWV